MAKHAHRIMLHSKKTWRCMLPGCSWFIHTGLEFTIPGKLIICWSCGEEFQATEDSIRDARVGDDMPICYDCKNSHAGGPSASEVNDLINAQAALSRAGVQYVRELKPLTRANMEMMGINFGPLERYENNQEEDQIEVTEPTVTHALDCESHIGLTCTCKEEN